MTEISYSANPVSVGRKPLDNESETETTTVRLTRRVRGRITAFVGEKGMAAFIRAAVESELSRRESTTRSDRSAADGGAS